MDAVGVLIIIALALALIVWIYNKQAEQRRRQEREAKQAEDRRLAECEQVVRYFANYHGYVARTVVSRDELAERIDSGASADDLASFIADRMLEADGLQLGYQPVGGTQFPVILPEQFRDKHIYVIGKSGYGKTNFLRYLILQDLSAGNGIGVLAPEFELLTEEILPFIPEYRIKDVIYFNPADTQRPIVINPLHLENGEDIDLHVDETFTILQRVVGEGGPRMDQILRHALYALTERSGSTLLDIELLLDPQNDELRKEIIRKTEDERTGNFFKSIYPQMPKDAHLPILNRIGRIVRSKYVRNCLCPPAEADQSMISKRMLDIGRAMDESKILLFNLSDGLLGEAASQLIGQFIVSKFQTATMARAEQAKQERNPFYLYLDEFQNFCGVAATSYEKILSRARKYRLGLILAHQQTGQIPLELLREIFGNVSTMVGFQVAQSDAAKLSREFISEYDFEIETVQPQEFLRLNVGQAWCRIMKSSFPMNVPKVDMEPNRELANRIIQYSREQYGIPASAIVGKQKTEPDQHDDTLDDLDPGEVF